MATIDEVSDEALRAAAREILAADEFTRWTTSYESWLRLLERLVEATPDWLISSLSWIQRVLEVVFGAIGRFLGLFGLFGDVSDGVGWIAVALLGAALMVGLWHWRSRRLGPPGSRAAPPGARQLHAEALREARAMALEGRFLLAAHRVQLATLALLIEFEWLELARSDPNRTLRDRVKASALPERERRELVALVDRLEALWFDEPRDDPVLFADWVSLDERIVAIATAGAA